VSVGVCGCLWVSVCYVCLCLSVYEGRVGTIVRVRVCIFDKNAHVHVSGEYATAAGMCQKIVNEEEAQFESRRKVLFAPMLFCKETHTFVSLT
jgi:hypothetical protein